MIVNTVQAAVADQVAVFVLRPVLVKEAESGTEPAAIDELDHGEQLFQLVFERSSGEHEGIAAFQLLDRARRGGGPVADALGFIEDDEVRRQLVHVAHIFEDQFVAGEVEELWARHTVARRRGSNPSITCAGRSVNFSISVFHWYFTEAGATTNTLWMPRRRRSNFRSGERLHGLAQTHVIGQDHPAPAGGEDGTPLLVGQEFGFQDSIERIVVHAAALPEAAFQIQTLGEFVLPVEVFQHVAVDDRIQVGLTESLEHAMETPVVLRAAASRPDRSILRPTFAEQAMDRQEAATEHRSFRRTATRWRRASAHNLRLPSVLP